MGRGEPRGVGGAIIGGRFGDGLKRVCGDGWYTLVAAVLVFVEMLQLKRLIRFYHDLTRKIIERLLFVVK